MAREVGISDNFFEIGGHSLTATRLASAVRSEFNVDVMVRVVFEHQTIDALSTFIGEANVSTMPDLVAVDHSIPQPLSFAQQRLWLIDQIEPGSTQYLMPYSLRFDGELNIDALTRALDAMIQRHKVLRTVYRDQDGQAVQVICDAHITDLPVIDISHLEGDAKQAEAQRLADGETDIPFDLANDLMLRAKLVKLADDDHLLLMTLHHIAADGWSENILQDELAAIFNAFKQGEANPLAPLTIQYVDFAQWQRNGCKATCLSSKWATGKPIWTVFQQSTACR